MLTLQGIWPKILDLSSQLGGFDTAILFVTHLFFLSSEMRRQSDLNLQPFLKKYSFQRWKLFLITYIENKAQTSSTNWSTGFGTSPFSARPWTFSCNSLTVFSAFFFSITSLTIWLSKSCILVRSFSFSSFNSLIWKS